MQGKKYKKLLSDTLLFSISNFGSKVLVFLLVPIYTNVLSTTEYGIVDLIVSTVNLLVPVLTISIAEGVLRFAFDKDVKREQLLSIAMLITAVSTLALFFLKPVAVLIKEQVGQYWGYLVLIYLLNALNAIFSSYTRGLDKTRLFAVKGIVYTASLIIFNILFLLVFKMGLRGYLFALIITEIITILVMVLAGKYLPELTHFSFNKKLFREILGYSLPMIPTVIAWWVMQLSDKYVIIAAVGIAASGVYSVAYKIPSILATFTSIFTQAWQISAIKSHGDSDNKSFVENVYKYFIIVSVLLCSGLILASKVLGHILYAKDYFIAWTYVPILLVAYHFSGLSGVLASVYSASKKTIMLFVSTSVGAVINIVLNIILIPKFGAAAAAYTTLLGFFITWVVREINVRKLIKIELSHLKFGLSFTLLLAEAVIMSAQCRFMYPISAAITLLQCALFIPEIKFICVKIVGALNMRRSKKNEK